MSKLVRQKDSKELSIQFKCTECGFQYLTSFSNLGQSYQCDRCKARVNTLPVMCTYEGCGGRYRKCGGTIKKLTDAEAAEMNREQSSKENFAEGSSRPTDDFHDEMGDLRAVQIAYKCDRCGGTYSLSYGISNDFDSNQEHCYSIYCDTCKRYPEVKDLPEPDQLYYPLREPKIALKYTDFWSGI